MLGVLEGVEGGAGEAGQAIVLLQEVVGQVHGALAPPADAQEDAEQLGIGEGAGAQAGQLLAGTFALQAVLQAQVRVGAGGHGEPPGARMETSPHPPPFS